MKDQRSADRLAKEYLYDLRNSAEENGFKPDEKWQLSLVTQADKAAIEKKYHNAVAAKAAPEDLSVLLELVREGLKQPAGSVPDLNTIRREQLQYLIAYNPARERR
jgi:hypothetical protein